MIKLKDILTEAIDRKAIVNKVYPQIVKNLGRARKGTPKVEFHTNIYARLSGIEGMTGDDNPHAEYDWDKNKIYQSSEKFFEAKKKQRIVLMTTKGSINYTKFKFKPDDTILFGRESAGVPEKVHKIIKNRLKIPMNNQVRSLNIASSVAIVLAESLRQIELI